MNNNKASLATLVEDLEIQCENLAEENASFANYLETTDTHNVRQIILHKVGTVQ